MNFLLHRHLALADLGSEQAAAGAMLPDLWRMADRRVRARPDIPSGSSSVLAGIAHHLEMDRCFHRAPLFTEGERFTAELFRRRGLAGPHKLLLFAHPAWELALDGALLHRHGLESTLQALDRAQEHLLGEEAAAAADHHHFDPVPRSPEDRQAFRERMSHLVKQLAHGDWVEGYTHGPGLADRLSGLRRRLRLPPLPDEIHQGLAEAMDEVLAEAKGRFAAALPLPST